MNTPNHNDTRPIDILLVEDNPMDAALARRMLQTISNEMPLTATHVPSAGTALAELRARTYDLVLLDYQLPDASGLDVLAGIRALPEAGQPAVIMLTATGSEKIAVEAMRAGARDYIRKEDMGAMPLTRAILAALTQKRLADQIRRHHEETETELRMARQLQEALMTRRFPDFPRGSTPDSTAIKFHARYLSAADLGGDFYEVFPVSDTEAGALICDVTGHGVPAALITAMLRALCEQLRPIASDPARFLAEMNRALLAILQDSAGQIFATAFYCVADISRARLRFANAGHPHQFLLHRTPTPSIAFLNAADGKHCPALGLIPDATYEPTTIPLTPGDLVILFTDGAFEVAGPDGEELGLRRLATEIQNTGTHPPTRILDTIIERGRQYSATGAYADDVCLLALEIQHLGT